MAQSEVIREFLVSLGFKTDEKSLKNFVGGIENATKSVTKLVAVIQGAALTVGAGISAFASNLEALYFAAQRTGSSAESLKAFQKAATNLGASSGEAMDAVERLANFLRYTPGAEGFLKGMGIDARDAKGNLRDVVDIMRDLGGVLSKKSPAQQKIYGDFLGISDRTLRALVSGEFSQELARQRERLKDSGFTEAAKDAHKFMTGLRELATYIEAFGLKVQDALMKKLGVSMEQLAVWFQKNGPAIAQRVADMIAVFMDFAIRVLPILEKIIKFFVDLHDKTGGLSTELLAILYVMQKLGAMSLITGIVNLGTAFVNLGRAIATANAAASGGTLMSLLARGGPYLAALGALVYSKDLNEGEQETLDRAAALRNGGAIPRSAGASKTPKVSARDTAGIGNPNGTAKAIAYFMSQGWSREQAAGLAANIKAESGFAHNAVGDSGKAYGLLQWHPDRQAAFAKWRGYDIRKSSFEDQLAFMHYELTQGNERPAGNALRAARTAQDAGRIASFNYVRPRWAAMEAYRRGNSAVQIAQQTTINVNGAGDPHAVGRTVAGQQGRVNEDILRNFSLKLQ